MLLVLTKRKHRTKTSSVLLLNLAVCDTLVSALCIPLDITLLVLERWIFGSALCKVIYPFQTSLPIVSSYTLMFMLLERNMIFSSSIRSRLRSTTVKLLALFSWLLPAAVVIPYALTLYVKGTGDRMSCQEKWSKDFYSKIYTVSLSVTEYLIPIIFISYFVFRIICCLRREQKLVKGGLLGLGRRTSKRRLKNQRRLAVIFIVMVVTYASLKLPNNIFWQWVEFGSGSSVETNRVVHIFVGLCAYSTCATNPFILILMSSEFRKDLHKMLCLCDVARELDGNDSTLCNGSERTALSLAGSRQSSIRRTSSTRSRRIPPKANRPAKLSNSSGITNGVKKTHSVTFLEPEEIPLTEFNTTPRRDSK